MTQSAIIAEFVKFILEQSQKEYNFKLEDITSATYNTSNEALRINLSNGENRLIQLLPNE